MAYSLLKDTARAKQMKYINVFNIHANINQPRKTFDDQAIFELAESIRRHGILNPLSVRKTEQGYELIAGERRLRAARLAGIHEVPCIILKMNDQKSAVLALVENIQRADLGFFEEAMAIRNLTETYGLTQEEIARSLGKSQSAVANKLRLLRHPKDIIERIQQEHLSERHARALLRIDDLNKRRAALQYIADHHYNVAQTEEYIDLLLRDKQEEPKKNKITLSVCKDVRLFLNTVNRAVTLMRRSGVPAELQKAQEDGKLILKIEIPSA